MCVHAGLTLPWYDDTKLTGRFASDVKDTTLHCPSRMDDFAADGYFAHPVPQRASDTDSLNQTGRYFGPGATAVRVLSDFSATISPGDFAKRLFIFFCRSFVNLMIQNTTATHTAYGTARLGSKLLHGSPKPGTTLVEK